MVSNLKCFPYRKLKLSRHIKQNPTNIALLLQEATKKYRKLTVYWTKCHYLVLSFSVFTANCASFAFLYGSFFSSCTQYFANLCRILNVPSDYLFSGLKMIFSKLSIARYHYLHKKTVFKITSIYVISCL